MLKNAAGGLEKNSLLFNAKRSGSRPVISPAFFICCIFDTIIMLKIYYKDLPYGKNKGF
jgi:hypothetical protein